ncbi:hypothetical protein PCASD_09449 [Puccinia coronata f. sp. avenae]|uniref:Hydrophobin n=1 Tax=Puccinia coronata f. sp. avenae TaxID=200324 RepID=A0A2N5UK68_9BASI|nr:hypothetical protein PCASD_09449 [Puccinia coronata f. sp. avenae]
MMSHFTKIYQITLVVLLLQLVSDSVAAGFNCTSQPHVVGLCAMPNPQRTGHMLRLSSNENSVLSCNLDNGQIPKCCASGTKATDKVMNEGALNKVCAPGDASATGTGTATTASVNGNRRRAI